MEQWTEPTHQPNSTPETGNPNEFNAAPLPAAEQQTHQRKKLQLLWGDLLQAAVRDPGLLLDAYSRFHGYSLGNRLAALVQCHTRGLEPGAIHTYQGWKQLGYQGRSGEKALWLCMPLTRKTKSDVAKEENRPLPEQDKSGSPEGDSLSTQVISAFVWKPHWFVLSQVDPIPGQEVQPIENPTLGIWNKARALTALGISEIPFDLLDGNCQGYAKERSIAVSPLAALPYKTLFHEMAHVVLGHTTQKENGILLIDEGELPAPQPRHVCEAEAEATALILLATLNLPGQEYCRGYIQSWLRGEGIGEGSARSVFGAADKMLRAGLSKVSGEDDDFTHGAPVPTPAPTTPLLTQAAENTLQPAMQFQQMPPTLALSAATLPRPPTQHSLAAFSLNGEWNLFQLLMGLHEASADLNPLHDPHPDVTRALAYLQAKDAGQAPALLFYLHRAAEALQGAAQVANAAINWPAIGEFYEPQALPFPLTKQPHSEARAALNGGFLGRSGTGPLPEHANNDVEVLKSTEAVNGTPTLNGKPSSARAEASARRSLGRALRSELVTEQRRFFLLAEKHELPTGRENAKVIREAISHLLDIPVKSRADLTAWQWALAGSAAAPLKPAIYGGKVRGFMSLETVPAPPSPPLESEVISPTLPLPPLTLRHDTTLLYRCGRRTSACRLRLFWPTQGVPSAECPAVALVTEMPEYGGLSVTNGSEAIALEISRCYGLHPRHTVLIEHYDDRQRGMATRLPGRINGEKFSCVTFGEMHSLPDGQGFTVQRPQWRVVSKPEVEALVGVPLS